MTRVRTAGIGVTVLGVVGYGVGTFFAYPGRAFSVTAMMVGITLWAIGGDA
ncbi:MULTISPECIES: hypothetical protein [Haloferax]|uniref:Uncharacterized protein n=1 Tax=Haloferax mediterranei (strain ATCC 33500 / DSM 1411 / JCM 8866 / NBRC 14739 / NCIMB 2177 / R-4) TaxID=523841 RepID=M0J5U2_HALMT|nr:hypothetical protein [Haloferax mediterranei]EMA04341.1 hypothetical protein C439_01662 [Haloferax mediterranei ATCC 33500]MDX5989574.1 hypothetical protein [Haloferax mediterranei ATCC 33500]